MYRLEVSAAVRHIYICRQTLKGYSMLRHRCRGLLLHVHTRQDSSGRGIGPSQLHLPVRHRTFTRDKHPCLRWDSNTQSQLASGRRPKRGHWSSAYVIYCRNIVGEVRGKDTVIGSWSYNRRAVGSNSQLADTNLLFGSRGWRMGEALHSAPSHLKLSPMRRVQLVTDRWHRNNRTPCNKDVSHSAGKGCIWHQRNKKLDRVVLEIYCVIYGCYTNNCIFHV